MIVKNYIPTRSEPNKIGVGIYLGQCIEVKDSVSKAGNNMSELVFQVESMKLSWKYVDILSVAWKNTQARLAFGFNDDTEGKIEFDTQDFRGKLARVLVGYSQNISQKTGEPYLEIVEFVEPGKEELAKQKLDKILKAEADRIKLQNAEAF